MCLVGMEERNDSQFGRLHISDHFDSSRKEYEVSRGDTEIYMCWNRAKPVPGDQDLQAALSRVV